jgi:glycosyltransferase involved in cell wall biosynthesis
VRVGVDVQLVAGGNRSGLYNCLRRTIHELRPLLHDELWLFAEMGGHPGDAGGLSAALDGARVHAVDQPTSYSRWWRRFSRLNRVDVLWHNLHGRLRPSTWAANAYLVPDVIPLAVDYGVPGLVDEYRPFYEAAARNGDVVIVFTNHARKDFLERVGGSPESIRVAHLAAGPEYRPVRDRARLREALAAEGLADVPYVLMVATVELRKNHAVLLRAFAQLLKKERALPHKLVLVGGKWIGHEAVFDLIRQLGLESRVVYTGFSNQLPALYAGADAFVYPSLYEGFGLPLLEAMASGVPVLAADATSLPEVAGDAGVLFPPQDVDRLCDALREIITDRTFHAECTRRGLERAATFSWRRTAELYFEAFELGLQRAGRSLREASNRPSQLARA